MNGDPSSQRWLDVENRGRLKIVRFKAARLVDDLVIEHIGQALLQFIQPESTPNLLLDLSAVQTLASGMLARLIRLYQAVKEAHGRLGLCGLRPEIADVLEVTKLNRVFTIYADVPAALAGLSDELPA